LSCIPSRGAVEVVSTVEGVKVVLEVDVVLLVNGRFGSMQTMETSSLCLQLCFPQPLWRQSLSCVSVPVQCKSSSQICPLPGPYLLLSERP